MLSDCLGYWIGLAGGSCAHINKDGQSVAFNNGTE